MIVCDFKKYVSPSLARGVVGNNGGTSLYDIFPYFLLTPSKKGVLEQLVDI